MYRAFKFTTEAGAYWSVIDDGTYETVTVADRFLQYVRFGRGRAESTTRKYAEAIALYLTFCTRRGVEWTDPDLTAFQMWLRVTPPLGRSATSTSLRLIGPSPWQQPHQSDQLRRLRNVQIRCGRGIMAGRPARGTVRDRSDANARGRPS